MYEGVDTVVLYEELAYQDSVPVQWRATSAPEPGNYSERNLRVLQACAALDEQGPVEKGDDNSPHSADMLRLEMKMNLLLDLVGRILVANQPRPPAVAVRFNAQGAVWKAGADTALPKPGDDGVVEIYLKDCLVEPLRLTGRVVNAAADGQIKVKFHNPGQAISDLIEKLAFRRHRRQIADQRQPRAFDPLRTGRFKLK